MITWNAHLFDESTSYQTCMLVDNTGKNLSYDNFKQVLIDSDLILICISISCHRSTRKQNYRWKNHRLHREGKPFASIEFYCPTLFYGIFSALKANDHIENQFLL